MRFKLEGLLLDFKIGWILGKYIKRIKLFMKIPSDVECDYIRLPKILCKKIEQLDDPMNFIQEYIDASKREIKASFDAFDDDILEYMASMQLLKSKFKSAADEAIKANYQVWEDMDKKRLSLRTQIAACVAELNPLQEEVERLNVQLNKVNTWDIQRFIEMIEKLKGHLYGEDRNIIEFLVNNYKKKE